MSTIEAIMKASRVAAFIIESLALKSYPNCLFWSDEANLTFCLLCPHRKKDEYKKDGQEVQSIFLDYNKFKVRKSVAADKDKRSVFLQAIKASPYVDIIKGLSTADKKVCIFTNRFKDLMNSTLGEFSLPTQLVENTAALSGIPIETSTPQTLDNNLETFMFLGSSPLESNGDPARSLECSSVFCNGSSPVENNAELAYGIQNSLVLSNASTPEQTFAIPTETESAVPCISLPETDNNQASLYATYNELLSFAENPQPENPQPSLEDCYIALNETQLSPSLLNGEYPHDYDPVEDLIRSQEPLQNSAENQLGLCPESPSRSMLRETQTSVCEILSIHGLEIVGNRVHILDRVEMNSTFNLDSPKYYMLKIKDKTEQQ